MKNITIITPVYNDWDSFTKLIVEIDKVIENFSDISFKLIAINDGSKHKAPKIKIPKNFKQIEILNMKINQGHAICLANGIKYSIQNHNFDYLILTDADGEDRPEEISYLIDKAKRSKNFSVVAKRVKRSEGPIFKMFYFAHKILTLVFTGKLMNFGNFSIMTRNDAELIIKDPTIISNYSGTLKKNIKYLDNIDCIRGKRYFGPSKMPFIKLIIHSFSIIAVFKMDVFIRSALILILLSYLHSYLGIVGPILQLMIVSFNILIYLISAQSSQKKLDTMSSKQESVELITH